ncbi:MAG: iron ABC transporter permease [Candidatus Cloacimonadota bacterium]|nr:iron ABC transporter permease [Candidatus Cloacimonadota bacterium]
MNKKILVIFFVIVFIILSYFYLKFQADSAYIISQVRFPRFLLAFLSGFILAGTGYTYQIMLNNPLAEPYILGVSSGAAFGSILASTLSLFLFMPLFGFIGGLLTMFLVWKLGHWGRVFNKTRLLLSGIIIGLFFSALISLIMYLNQQDIGSIINVLMGNLGHIFSNLEWNIFTGIFIISLGLMFYLFSLSKQLNILVTGDLVATSLGVDVASLRKRIFIISSLLVGITVAYAGIIGFVGLVVPHLIRMILGGNKPYSIFISAFAGAFLLILCDFVAMHIAVIEIPVGTITAFIGCPFFIIILLKK